MTLAHVLGYPRIGTNRELKRAVEAYWRGEIKRESLEAAGRELRAHHWQAQRDAGLDLVTVGDFAFYDQVLNVSVMVGAVPARFAAEEEVARGEVDLDTQFRMARGRAPSGTPAAACEMTKYFDTNYHYLVPELHEGQQFRLASSRLFDEVAEARAAGHSVKVALTGPLTWLWLGKGREPGFDRLSLLESLLPVYGEILARLAGQGVEWVQLDEPALVQELPVEWRNAYEFAYNSLRAAPVKLLMATYFGGLGDNLRLAVSLPVDGLHIDTVRAPEQLPAVLDNLPGYKVLSVGAIDGRNVWRADLALLHERLANARMRLGERLWLAPSCSLLHVPVDLEAESELDAELKSWLAFARQKLDETVTLARLLGNRAGADERARVAAATAALDARRASPRLHRPEVAQRLASVSDAERSRGIDMLVHGEAERNDMVEYFGEQLDGYAFTRNGWVQSYGSRCVKPPVISAT
jgi:5-methyltetrahydropteroyltriglutamate--homocysteine methyltransferase